MEPMSETVDRSENSSRRERALQSDGNHCFVCGPANPIGLAVTFRLDGDVCRAEFTPQPQHSGYDRVTHGGIVFSLLDDVMANWIYVIVLNCRSVRLFVWRGDASGVRGGWRRWRARS